MIENEKKDFAAGLPLPLERAGRGAAEPTTAEQSFFRGEPIAWLTVPTTKTIVTANVFGDSEAKLTQGPRSYGLPVCTGPKATKKW